MPPLRRGVALLLCLLLAWVCCLSGAAQASSSGKTVRVGWFESPFNSTDQFGRRSGYAYEYQQQVAAYTGWSYEYVEGSWPELYQKLLDGEIDLMSDVSYTPERAEQMLFSYLPMGEEEYYLFISQTHDSGISAEDLTSLDGKRIGVNKGSIQSQMFRDWVAQKKLNTEIVELTVSENEMLEMLNRGEVDATVSIDASGGYPGAIPICKIGASSFYFAVNKARPDLLSELNSAMSRIQNENKSYNEQLQKKYISTFGANLFLTQQELTWLSSHGPVRVGYRDNYLAFCGTEEKTGQLTGALAEFLSLASHCTMNAEIAFEPIAYSTTTDALTALQNGEIDCVFPLCLSAYDAEEAELLLTMPQMQTEMYAVVRSSTQQNFSLQGDVSAAVSRNNPNYDTFLMDNFPDWKRVYYADTEECLQAVARGEADCVLVSNYRVNRLAERMEQLKLSTVATGTAMYASLGVRRQDSTLCSILNKVTNLVSESAVNSALTSYSYVERKVTFADYLQSHVLAVLSAAGVILALILVLLLRSRRSEKKAIASERETKEAMEQIEALNAELSKSKKSLQEALVASQQASRAKTAFLSNMSHEIRTPLNAIIGFTSLAEQNMDERDRVLGYIQKISTSGKHLLSLINDVLDVSRIESGRMVLRDEAFDFRELLVQINTMIGGQCGEKGLVYTPRIIGTVSSSFSGDAMKLKEVLINILGNAVKYTPSGGSVHFSVEQIAAYEDLCTLRFIVRDTGIGMSEEYLPRLFEAFSQEQDDNSNQFGSTGLGMAITKSIVQLMNGEISVESKKGVGSTFTVTVTLKDLHQGVLTETAALPAQEGAENPEPDEQGLAGLRVLIVEDVEFNAELLADILDLEEIEHEWVENGQLAVDCFSEHEPGYFDAILMDVRMPVMDGLQATRCIRALERPDAKTIPIIAMSANAFSEDVQRSLQAGMTAHLSKPVDMDRLFEELSKSALRRGG